LDENTRTRILNEIDSLEKEINDLNMELVAGIENTSEFDELIEKYNYEVDIKKDLVNQLNTSIKENEISLEKINLLIENYVQEKAKMDEVESKNRLIKIVIFFAITIALF
jgi:seryl-tRNA synthetase